MDMAKSMDITMDMVMGMMINNKAITLMPKVYLQV